MKILIVFVILLLLSTNAYALSWSDASASVPSGVQYNPDRVYGFQISWDAGTLSISEVLFEIGIPATGNYSNESVSNISNVYFINFSAMDPRDYAYRWFAVDNESNWNVTDYFSYSVTKNTSASINLYLNGTEANRSYRKNDLANFTAILNIPNKAIFLDSSYPGLNLYNDSSVIYYEANLTSEGFFILNASWNGNIYYTGTSKSFYFDTIPPQYSNLVSSPLNAITYAPRTNYSFNITWTDATLTEVRFESNYSGSKKNYTKSSNPKVYNESGNFWFNLTDLPAKDFIYRWYAKDSLNNWSATEERIYRIYKAFALTLYSPFDEIVNGTTSVANCYSLADQITTSNFKFYRNATLINNTSSSARTDVTELPVGFYEYVCNTSGNQNYSNQTLRSNITVLSSEDELSKNKEKEEFKITKVSSPYVNVGRSGEGTFDLSSTLNDTVTEISVQLTGIDTGIYTVEGVPSALLKGGSVIIRVNFDIPDDYPTGVYNITIKATGKAGGLTKTATGNMKLTVSYAPPVRNIAPTYSNLESEGEGNEAMFSFSLYDDQGLSGYIFSINSSGQWVNDSWVALSGTFADIDIEKQLESREVVAWKVFLNDSENLWSATGEYIVMMRQEEFDFTIPIIIIIASVIIAVVFFILKRGGGETGSNVFYVYTKEDSR